MLSSFPCELKVCFELQLELGRNLVMLGAQIQDHMTLKSPKRKEEEPFLSPTGTETSFFLS